MNWYCDGDDDCGMGEDETPNCGKLKGDKDRIGCYRVHVCHQSNLGPYYITNLFYKKQHDFVNCLIFREEKQHLL